MSTSFPRPLAGLDLEAGVLVERWMCRKADGYISPGLLPCESGEQPAAWLRRQWWAVRGLVAMWYRLAERCPHLEAGIAAVRIALRENEVTIDHQGVHLRFVLAACPSCPSDPRPDEQVRAERRQAREIAEPSSCGRCGIARRSHGAGHAFETPTDRQILDRMYARRAVGRRA